MASTQSSDLSEYQSAVLNQLDICEYNLRSPLESDSNSESQLADKQNQSVDYSGQVVVAHSHISEAILADVLLAMQLQNHPSQVLEHRPSNSALTTCGLAIVESDQQLQLNDNCLMLPAQLSCDDKKNLWQILSDSDFSSVNN